MNKLEIAELFDEAADYWGVGEKFTPNQLAAQLKAWSEDLSEYSYTQVANGIRAYRRSKDGAFFPKTGQIIQYIVEMNPQDDFPNEQEALSMVIKAVRNGIYGADEEFSKLPPIVQKAVGAETALTSWATQQSDSSGVWQSQFLRSYRTVLNRANSERNRPPKMRYYTNALADQAAPEIEQKPDTETLAIGDKSPKGKALEAVRKAREALGAT